MKRTFKEIKIASDARALKKLRISHNLSRKDLASRLKVSVSAVEKIERGVDNLSEERVLKILQTFVCFFSGNHEDLGLKIKLSPSPEL